MFGAIVKSSATKVLFNWEARPVDLTSCSVRPLHATRVHLPGGIISNLLMEDPVRGAGLSRAASIWQAVRIQLW